MYHQKNDTGVITRWINSFEEVWMQFRKPSGGGGICCQVPAIMHRPPPPPPPTHTHTIPITWNVRQHRYEQTKLRLTFFDSKALLSFIIHLKNRLIGSTGMKHIGNMILASCHILMPTLLANRHNRTTNKYPISPLTLSEPPVAEHGALCLLCRIKFTKKLRVHF